MSLGKNLQYLRKQKKITQEKLADIMSVSRQTISKWEADEAVPEINKLIDLSDFFACKMDALVREDLGILETIFSEVTIKKLKSFKMARYVMITPNPEDDVITYMRSWAEKSGLLAFDENCKQIGWDFPFVTAEQQNRFGLRGYSCAYILPEGFETTTPGVEYAIQDEAEYAVITVEEPFKAAFDRIPNAYKKILEYLEANGFKENIKDNLLPCFEYTFEKDGITYMDVFVLVDGVTKADVYTAFS